MVEADGQVPEPTFLDPFRETGGFGEFADGLLDGRFPDSRRADVDVRLVVEPVLDVVGKRGVVGQPPEHDVRVEQQAHGPVPKSSAMASLDGAAQRDHLGDGRSRAADDDLLAVLDPLNDP